MLKEIIVHTNVTRTGIFTSMKNGNRIHKTLTGLILRKDLMEVRLTGHQDGPNLIRQLATQFQRLTYKVLQK
jgi:hypothetical protein